MENISRRKFMGLGLGAAGYAGLQACTHRSAVQNKQYDAPVLTEGSIDDAIKYANDFAESHKSDLSLSHQELKSAAVQYKNLYELAASYDGEDKVAKATEAQEARQKLLGVVDYGLRNGEGQVHIEINGKIQRGVGVKNESWAYKTDVKSKDLADILKAANDDGVLKKDEVINLVAGSQSVYQGLPDHTLDVSEMPQRGYVVLGSVNRVNQLLGSGSFKPLKQGALDYTRANHVDMAAGDVVQGVYNRRMPAAVQLIMTKLPGYEAVQKQE